MSLRSCDLQRTNSNCNVKPITVYRCISIRICVAKLIIGTKFIQIWWSSTQLLLVPLDRAPAGSCLTRSFYVWMHVQRLKLGWKPVVVYIVLFTWSIPQGYQSCSQFNVDNPIPCGKLKRASYARFISFTFSSKGRWHQWKINIWDKDPRTSKRRGWNKLPFNWGLNPLELGVTPVISEGLFFFLTPPGFRTRGLSHFLTL